MDSNLEECPTGILVDFEENTTITISSDCNKEFNGDLSDSDAVTIKHGTEELSLGCQTVLLNGGVHKISSSNCLGAELNNVKDEVCFSKIEWRSPSPTTMNMISREASRIVDQLHTTLETSLWEEEFPLSSISEDEYFEDASVGYKESSCNKMLKESCDIVEEGSCFNKRNGCIDHLNFVLENSKVKVDNSVYKENKNIYQADLNINTYVENAIVVLSREKYATAKKCDENSPGNSFKIEETFVLNKKNCVIECSTTTALNHIISEQTEICSLTENNCTTEKNSFSSEVKSNATDEVGSIHLSYVENIASTEESNVSTEVYSSSYTGKSNTLTDVDSDSGASTKESNELVEIDSIATTPQRSAPNEVDGSAPNEVGASAPNEVGASAPNEVGAGAPNEVGASAPNEVGASAPNEVGAGAPNEVGAGAPNEVGATAPNEVDGNAPNEVDGTAPNEVDGTAPNEIDDSAPTKVESSFSIEESYVRIEVQSNASSKGILRVSDKSSYIHIRDTCNDTEDISKDSEVANIVEEDNLSVFGEHKQKLRAKTSKPNNDKCMGNTPLTKKSKLTKIFKTPSFKTPFKSKFQDKENIAKDCKQNNLSEKVSKIEQVSSIKGILSASNTKGSMSLTSKSSIKTPINTSSVEKMPLGKESKATMKVSQHQAKEKPHKFDTPLKRMSLAKFQPPLNGKTSLGKSYSLAETPHAGKTIRRSSSFQTRQIENTYQFKKARSFIGESRPAYFKSRMSLAQTQPIGNKLSVETPSNIRPFLPKSTTANPNAFGTPFSSNAKLSAKELQSCKPPFGSALRQTNAPTQSVPQVVVIRRPASTTSKTRFTSRLELPSPLPKILNDNLARRLFSDYSTPSLKSKM